MRAVRLGKSGLMASRVGMGCIPIQRVSEEAAIRVLREAYEGGVRFFDTARMYTTSEERIGKAFEGMRDEVVIATKTNKMDYDGVMSEVEISLRNLKTDYIDLYQHHNMAALPDKENVQGAYQTMLKLKEQSVIRHIGITTHSLDVAAAAVESGQYETLQFPLSYLSGEKELDLIALCKQHDMGIIAMKALAGGLITSSRLAAAFFERYDNIVPIWGIERPDQLAEFLLHEEDIPQMDKALAAEMKADQAELSVSFCRACGYCLPCPAEIEIPTAARMGLLIRRMPAEPYMTEEAKSKMMRIENCTSCYQCQGRCPYELNTPALLRAMYADYKEEYARITGKRW